MEGLLKLIILLGTYTAFAVVGVYLLGRLTPNPPLYVYIAYGWISGAIAALIARK